MQRLAAPQQGSHATQLNSIKQTTTSRPAARRQPRRDCVHSSNASPILKPDGVDSEPTHSRRAMLSGLVAGALLSLASGSEAAPEPSLVLATPPVAPAVPLTAREQQIISVFSKASGSVVNVFDVALQGRGPSQVVDVPEGNGTGIIWDNQGHVVSNYHVLATSLKNFKGDVTPGKGPRVARVTLVGDNGLQQTYDGVLVGADRNRDLVVLRINAPAEQLRPVTLGTSADLQVGQQVLAIGCPFGFDSTLTTGVVSGLNREIRSLVGTNIPGGIQTDAAINPGNSGGPLLDSAGRLIGVNTAIFTNTGTSVGIGFAIPIDIVARVVPQLIENGRVIRPSLGVQIANEAVAGRLRVTKGALIQALVPGGAAEKAGLLPTRRGLQGIIAGDVVVGISPSGGRPLPVSTPSDLTNVLDQNCAVGQEVAVFVKRTGDGGAVEEKKVMVTLLAE